MSLRTRISQLRQWHHCYSLNTQHFAVRLPYTSHYSHTRRSLSTIGDASSNSAIPSSPISRCISDNKDKPQRKHLYGWGQGLHGLKQADTLTKSQLSAPVHLTELESIMDMNEPLLACGWRHSLVASNNNSNDAGVYGFGLNSSGQLGIGKYDNRAEGKVLDLPLGKIKLLAAGREHSIVVVQPSSPNIDDASDQILAFGGTTYGQLGVGMSKWRPEAQSHISSEGVALSYNTPRLVRLPSSNDHPIRIRQVVCGMDHTVFLTESGELYACGWGADGQLGQPESSDDYDTPRLVTLNTSDRVVKLAATTDFTLALTDKHELFAWGNGEYGQCMTGAKIDRLMTPTKITTLPSHQYGRIVDMAAGGSFALALTENGHVFSCGYGILGQRDSSVISSIDPLLVPDLPPIRQLACSTNYAMAIDEQGQLYTWGLAGLSGVHGQGHSANVNQPTRIELPSTNGATTASVSCIACGGSHVLAILDELA
ncbi:regulator of chromosome condensation 1/beta-lactamase-inhibitor protein II [Syncephalis plumigaleata]|nr:regulator of chromosome condensation 1/beta-lactamase-inhibitor protein II [Syncephalis plumigaleata]